MGFDFCSFHASGDQLQLSPLARKIFKEPNVQYRKAASGSQNACWPCMTYRCQVLTLGLDATRQEEGWRIALCCYAPIPTNTASPNLVWEWEKKEKRSKIKYIRQQNRYEEGILIIRPSFKTTNGFHLPHIGSTLIWENRLPAYCKNLLQWSRGHIFINW